MTKNVEISKYNIYLCLWFFLKSLHFGELFIGSLIWRVVAERLRAKESSSGVSDQQSVGRVPVVALVLLSKTLLYHNCFVPQMGH